MAPVAVGHGAVWVPAAEGGIARIDPESFEVDDTISVTSNPSSIATGIGGVWTVDDLTNTAFRIDPASANAVTRPTPVGQGPAAVAVGDGAVWVANTQDDTVTRIDPGTTAVTQTIPVGSRPTGIAAGEGAVWVANSLGGTVSRIDPETNQVEATIEVGEAPQGVTIAHGLVWVSVQAGAAAPDAPSVAVGEDVARVVVPRDAGSPDPALLFPIDHQIDFATSAGLYSYPDRPFPEGIRLVPEVAAGEPLVSDHGRTYRFRIRPGFRFSPPSNEPVTAEAFERALERILSPAMHAGTPSYVVSDIVGADDYLAGRTNDPRGRERAAADVGHPADAAGADPARTARDVSVLRGPAGHADQVGGRRSRALGRPLLRRLVHPWSAASCCAETPTTEGSARRGWRRSGTSSASRHERGVEEVEAGRADYVLLQPDGATPVLPQVAQRLAARYGPRSEAARRGPSAALHPDRTRSVFLRLQHPPRPVHGPAAAPGGELRDRPPRAGAGHGFGQTGRPTDQYIPPGFPGFEDAAIYPLDGPDLAAARRLAGDERHDAVLYTCDFPGCIRNAQILRSNLDAIGIDLQVQQFPGEEMFPGSRTGRSGAVGRDVLGWAVDYADPYNFINEAFGPPAAYPGNFRDPGLWKRMAAADRLSGDARFRAYARLDRDLAERAAPVAPFASLTLNHFLSARMGCQVLHPLYGLDLAALCVRDEEE